MQPPRQNFNSFYTAFETVFQIMTLENWNDLLVATMRTDVNIVITMIFLISWIFIGNYVLLNLFLAILLEGFESEELLQEVEGVFDDIEIAQNLDLDTQQIGGNVQASLVIS